MVDVPPPADPLSYIWYLLAQVTAQIGDLTYNLQSALLFNIQQLTQQLAGVTGQIAAGIQHLLSGLASTIAQVVDGVLYSIQQYLGPLLDTLGTIARQLQTFFTNLLARLETVVLGLWQEITRRVGEALQWLASVAVDVKNGIVALVSSALDTLAGLYTRVRDAIVSLLDRALTAVGDVARRVTEAVASGVSGLLGDAQRIVKDTTNLITQGWERLVSGSESLVEQIREKLGDVATGFGDAADVVADALKSLLPEQLPDVLDTLKDAVAPLGALFGEEMAAESRRVLDEMISPNTLKAMTRQELAGYLRSVMGESRVSNNFFRFIVGALISVQLLQGIASANATAVQGEYSIAYPWNQLQPADVVAAWRRGLLTNDAALMAIRWHGYDQEDAERIIKIGQSPPAPTETIALWRREIIDEDKMQAGLAAAGVAEEWTEPLIRGSEYIPPIQDLITMAVREAFTPEIAQRFGQYEDFPEQLAEWAQKQGMSPQWAQAYWAAHWGLPSVQMGYEMLHRGVIERGDLELLLRAQDVMPWWRDKLVAISYAPYTRVDVRRMHKLGILTEAQVKRAYMDLGYDDERADNLTAFTVALNKPAEIEETGELGKLTRASVLGFYRDGLVKADRARQLLVEQGISEEAATLYIQQVDVDEADAERKAEAGLIVELALAGEYTRAQAQEKLNELGLGSTEVEKILAQLFRKLAAKTKIPSRSEGEQMLKAGIIQAADYKSLLSALGYTERWQDAFVKLAQAKGGRA